MPEDISKDKEKKASFRKSSKDFKILDGYQHTKGKEGWYLTMIENF